MFSYFMLINNVSKIISCQKNVREPRGFGFVKFRNPEDAAEAKAHLNRSVIGGREIRIVFAEENRKTPQEMRKVSRLRCVIESVSTFSCVSDLPEQLQIPFSLYCLYSLCLSVNSV